MGKTKEVKEVKISFLDFPENIRTRPTMYLMNPNHCVQEIIDNAIDEHMAGFCTDIHISIDTKTKMITVSDNGRGIPVIPSDIPKYKGISSLEVAMTSTHAGGKFLNVRKDSYDTITTGLNGMQTNAVVKIS